MSDDLPWKAFFDESREPRLILEVERSQGGLQLKLVAANEAWETTTGISRDVAIGCHEPDFLPQAFAETVMCAARRCVETRAELEFEAEVALSAGPRIWHTRFVPWPRRGEARFVIGFARDVTDISNAQQALRESESRYRLLADNAPDIVHRWRIHPVVELEYMSPSTERILGYTPEEFLEQPDLYARIVHPDDREALAKAQDDVLAGRLVVLRVLHKSGRIVWTETRNVPVFDETGECVAIEGIARDITLRKSQEDERRKLEQRLVETQKLESLGLLAGGIAHDFNNLLAGILGHTSLLRSEAGLEQAPEHLLQIERAALQAAALCKQLLAYSGRGRFTISKIDLGDLVRDAYQLLQLSLTGSAKLSFDLAPTLPPISGDPSQIRQVIVNLVINAAEALEGGQGSIAVSARTMLLDEDFLKRRTITPSVEPGQFVMLEIADDGAGMTAETAARIFDPFFTTKFTGRGLGLSAVLGIVRSHQGGIHVQSEPGEGTTFTLVFPAVAGAAERSRPRSHSTVEWRSNGSILVVDDEQAVRNVASRMLQALGFEPIPVASGAEAIQRFSAEPSAISAVLLDLTMPVMDGDAVFREIRRIAADVPVLVMSGYSEQEATLRFAGRGLTGFVQKPFTLTELAERLQATLQARTGNPQSAK